MTDIAAIFDDGLLVADLLRAIGISTTDDLLSIASQETARKQLARQILDWVSSADLRRIKGIGPVYVRLLNDCEVRSTRELRHRTPCNLAGEIALVNARLRMVERVPPAARVARWIAQAQQLHSRDVLVLPRAFVSRFIRTEGTTAHAAHR